MDRRVEVEEGDDKLWTASGALSSGIMHSKGSLGGGGNNINTPLMLQSIEKGIGVFQGYMDEKVLASKTKRSTGGEEFVVEGLIDGEAHVFGLSEAEAFTLNGLKRGWRLFGWGFLVKSLSTVTIGVDGKTSDVAVDDETPQAGVGIEGHEKSEKYGRSREQKSTEWNSPAGPQSGPTGLSLRRLR